MVALTMLVAWEIWNEGNMMVFNKFAPRTIILSMIAKARIGPLRVLHICVTLCRERRFCMLSQALELVPNSLLVDECDKSFTLSRKKN